MSGGSPNDDDGSGYAPSPYPLAILPRVRHAKPRPTKIDTVDVPPTPLTVQGEGDGGGGKEMAAEEQQGEEEGYSYDAMDQNYDGDSVCKSSPAAIAAVSTTHRRRRRKEATSSSAPPTPTNAKIVEVIDDKSPPTTAQTSNNAPQNQCTSCATCNKNVARYACPKCGAPYCSVACYKIHDGSSLDPSSNGGEGKVCTESFFKDRVLGMYGKGDEDGDKLRGILARMHRDINANLDDAERREESLSHMLKGEGGVEGLASDMRSEIKEGMQSNQSSALKIDKGNAELMSDDDLAELADYVLQMDDGEESDLNREILESIPPHLLHAFECALAAADEASDAPSKMPLERDAGGPVESMGRKNAQSTKLYTLWWLPGENDELHISTEPTLDDRILSLPPLPKARSSSGASLSYNILEVLYAAIFAIRVKCNAANASTAGNDSQYGNEIDEAALLLSQSLVLSQDARFDSVRGAMMACSEQLVENKKLLPVSVLKHDEKMMTWDALALDVATLAFHRRYVLRMLFEALDICQLGVEGVKSELKQIKAQRHRVGASAKDIEASKRECEETKKKYKLAAKKIEYFLSWCSSMWSPEMGQDLSDEVHAYVSDWKLDVQTQESSVERLIRGIHSGGDEDGAGLPLGGILDIGGSQPPSLQMGEQMVSISTVRKKA